jgi:hypothetical protein
MNTTIKVILALGVVGFLGLFVVGGSTLGLLNKEADLRTAIVAKHEDNLSEYNNMKLKIRQSAQVSEKEAEVIANIIANYTEGRGSNANVGGGLINAVAEAVPNVNVVTLQNLQNIIVGSRNSWTMRQKELVSLSQQHNQMLNRPISGLVLGIFGKEAIDIKIVATAEARADFESEEETVDPLF